MPTPKKNTNTKTKTASKKPLGRPSLYKPEYNEQVYKLCLLGATDVELADFFGVVESTLNLWKKEHPIFSESIKKGKQMADANVADKLYNRALGYEHPSEEIKVVSEGSGLGSKVERVKVTKIYPPDTVAAIFWLKNRQPKLWRDKQEIDHTTNGNEIKYINLGEGLPPEEPEK